MHHPGLDVCQLGASPRPYTERYGLVTGKSNERAAGDPLSPDDARTLVGWVLSQ
jgi:hypothetical protein